MYLKSDIDPWLIIPLLYLFADVTQSHAHCSFTKSLKGKIFMIFEYQLSGLRQAFQVNNGHASPELVEKLAEALDLKAKQVRLMSFTTLCIILSLKKV